MAKQAGGGNHGRRKPNINLIQTSRCYTVSEIAKRLDRTVCTVRSWIKQGLPVMPNTSPRLIDGAELKVWLKAKWVNRKKPCGIGEMYCCKCCKPRAPDPESVKTVAGLVQTTAQVRGKCSVCGTTVQQARKLENLPEVLDAMRGQTKGDSNLVGYRDPSVKPTLWQGQGTLDFDKYEGGSDSVH